MKATNKKTGLEVEVVSVNFETKTAKLKGAKDCIPLDCVELKGEPGFKVMTVPALREFLKFFGDKPPAFTELMVENTLTEFVEC